MKNILTTMSFVVLVFTAHTQTGLPVGWGNWGIGPFKDQSSLNVYQPYHIQGYHIYYNWSDLEPTKDHFTWASLDSQMQTIAQNNLWIGVQIMVGPNCPAWIYDSVPKVFTTGGNNNGPYPYYLNTYYTTRFINVFKQAANHFKNLSPFLQSHFLYWQICAGSTGDEDPYKGTVTNNAYAIDYYTWEAYREASWDSANTFATTDRYYRFLFNTGNYAQDLDYVHTKYPLAFHKNGLLSHDYSFDGENLYFNRQYTDTFKVGDIDRTRGEVQDIYNNFWWTYAPVKQAFELAASALSGGMDMLDITPALISSISNDTRPMVFFQKYAGLREAHGSYRAFIALRDVPDFADSVRFPTKTYGPVIDPTKLAAYNAQISNINKNPQDSPTRKYWLCMKVLVQYENPARITAIVNQFKSAGAMYSTTDEYHDDFGSNMTHNFRRFMTQVGYKAAFDSTSYGAWRIGPDTSIYGRYARLCKLDKNGKGQMYFQIYDSVVDAGSKLNISVTYYDTGNGKWSINCSNTSTTVTNTGTRKWLTKSITISSYKGRTLFSGAADIGLQYVSGNNTPFALIEIQEDTTKTSPNLQPQLQQLSLTVSPNPNSGQLKVSFAARKEEKYSVFITDVSGNSLFTETRQSIKGNNQWNISTNLGRGSYVLHIESPTTTGVSKFIVIK